MARIILIRHAESTSQGPDSPLTAAGALQAEALSDWLQAHFTVDRIVSSPFRRALDTIRPFARTTNIGIEVDERIREREAKPFPSEAKWLSSMRLVFTDLDYRADGAETRREVRERGIAALRDVMTGLNELTAMVSHGQLSSCVLGAIDASVGYEAWRAMTNPDAFLIEASLSGRLRYERVWTPRLE